MIWVWLGIGVAAMLAEALTLDLLCLWYAVGSFVALIAAAFGAPLWLQIGLALIFAFATMIFLRPFAFRVLKLRERSATNADALIGTEQRLLTDITFDRPGTLRVHGVVWNAVTADGGEIPAQSIVVIEEIRGNKLLVSPAKQRKEA